MGEALAVFVKTLGHSPVKTRLAQTIGQAQAEEFYRLSCAMVSELMGAWQRGGGQSYWAVAENTEAASQTWRDFPTIAQGEGPLGTRLHHVYQGLRKTHERVLLIGADAPQLTLPTLKEAVSALSSHDFVMGPAKDGGFYLFAGKRGIPRGHWEEVTYSVEDTRAQLMRNLAALGPVKILPRVLTDVDTAEDLTAIQLELNDPVTPCEKAMSAWLRQIRKR